MGGKAEPRAIAGATARELGTMRRNLSRDQIEPHVRDEARIVFSPHEQTVGLGWKAVLAAWAYQGR
jgi:hypothetical protein